MNCLQVTQVKLKFSRKVYSENKFLHAVLDALELPSIYYVKSIRAGEADWLRT